MNQMVPRQTVEQVCSFRDAAIAKYAEAFERIAEAGAVEKEARVLWNAAAPGIPGHWSNQQDEIKAFFNAVAVPDRSAYMRTAKRLIDVTCWTFIIDQFGIERFMDKQAKDELRSQMAYVPERRNGHGELINQDEIARMLPEVTPENVYATLERLQADAELIFRRGLVNVFTKLDRRFRSHDGFKVGSRMIITRMVDEQGWFRTYGDRVDVLTDIERIFLVIDKQPPCANYAGIVAQIDRERKQWTPAQSEHEGEFFKVRLFKNGNAHLWFTQKDLLEKVNKILADHYGETLGDGMTKEADPLKEVKTTPAKRYGFFPTPDGAASDVFRNLSLLRDKNKPRLRILEPSAGTGNLARRCIMSLSNLDEWRRERYENEYRFDNAVDCIEIQPHLAQGLLAEGIYNRVICADFLTCKPDPANLYDIVAMNPPFDRERDIDHVMHAMSFLKPDGQLVAIMSAGTEFRETKKSAAFRKLMAGLGASWDDLPPGSFAEAGTYINTGILSVRKNGNPDKWRPTWQEYK